MGFDNKIRIYQNFVSDWKRELNYQDRQYYEKYLIVFLECMAEIWNYKSDDGVGIIEQQCYNIASCLLASEKNIVKERGIEFIQEIYKAMWRLIYKYITEEKIVLNQYKREFLFFADISDELIQSMDELSIENVEKRIRFDDLAELIQRVAIWFRNDEINNEESGNCSGEINELNHFAIHLGYYLKKKKKPHITDQDIWANVLKRWYMFSAHNIPKGREGDFLKSKVKTYFSYCYGMIVNGHVNVIKQGLYYVSMKYAFSLDNKYQAIFYLCVHCYIYYLAIRESDNCVTEDIRQSAKNIWDDNKVKDAFIEFLNKLAENSEWLNLDVLDEIGNVLNGFELFPQYEMYKNMIIEYVVSDFYLFLILFMEHQFFLPDLLDRNIDDIKAFRYVSDDNEGKTKELIKSLFKMVFIGTKSDEQIDVEIGLMYDTLEKTVKKKQKNRYIMLAKDTYRYYSKNS